MADYDISNVPRRVVYAASGVGPYAFTFEVLSSTDIAVYKGDQLLTLTTDYTVSIASNGTGSITLVSTAGTSNITIVGAKTIARTTDFTTGGDFFANTLNDELDAQTIFIQQVAETAERGLKAPVTDPTDINMTLPAKASRKGKVLSFDVTTGDPIASFEAGDISNAQSYATAAAASAAAASSSQSTASSAASSATSSASTATTKASEASSSAASALSSKNSAETAKTAAELAETNAETAETNAAASATLANDWATKTSAPVAGGEYSAKYHAQAASTSAGSASSSASTASSAQVAAESARDATLAAFDSFDDRYLGSKTSDPALDNDGNPLVAGALYFNSVSGVMNVYTGSAWVAAYVSGSGYLAAANNLSDLANASTSRTNLGLGTLATQSPSGTASSSTYLRGDNTWASINVTPALDDLSDVTITTPSTDQVLKYNGSGWVNGAAPAGGQYFGTATTKAIAYNADVINENVSVTENGLSVGPITIGSSYAVTVSSGKRWVVL